MVTTNIIGGTFNGRVRPRMLVINEATGCQRKSNDCVARTEDGGFEEYDRQFRDSL
jgi:hypothetical protein